MAARISARRKRIAQGVALSIVAGTLAVLAIRFDGSPIHDVELNDGGVWVSNAGLGMMARLNSQVKELELGVNTTSTSSHIFQEANSVEVFDDGGGGSARSVAIVDVLSGVAAPLALPASFEVAAHRSTVALLDDESGRLWIRRSDRLEGFESAPPDAEVSAHSSVAVTTSGTALALDRAAGTVTAWRLDQQGVAQPGETHDFETAFEDDPVLSAVGEQPVVGQDETVLVAGRDPVRIEGDEVTLQQVGPDSEDAMVATRTGLWSVPLDGGEPDQVSTLDVEGTPAAPAVVAGCINAAWNDPGTDNYQRLCAGSDPFAGEISPLTDAAVLVFRSNRDVVVLNDSANGTAWMVQEDGLTRVDNWESVNPDAKDPQEATVQDDIVERERNRPPEAKPDEFGVRPGGTVILPVTLNDIDPDGDILTLRQPPASTNSATFSVVGEGTQVQAKIGPNAAGTLTFEYEITDGRPENKSSRATVTLKVHGADTDGAPTLLKDQTNELHVAAGHQAVVNVLPAWIDPEGDSLALVGASSDGGKVGFRPDGTIEFTDDDGGTGSERIDFEVRGGNAVATGSVAVTVQDPAKAAPRAVADHFSGVVGSTILLEPTANDADPLGGQLTVPRMRQIAGGAATLTKDPGRGTATFRADGPGTYYLEYIASSSNGQTSEPTWIRVDVIARSSVNRPPVATRDVAAVPPSGSILVDVLANDADPDGDVMIVQGVEVSQRDASTVKASLVNKRFVRVEVSGDVSRRRPEVSYLLSDGRSDQVRGAIAVTSADRGKNRPPRAVEDIVSARAGTVIDIPVLANDEDPDGDKLTVAQQDLSDLGPDKVVTGGRIPIVATGASIRVLVPDDGTRQLQFSYGVRDPEGARADTRLVLNIKPDDALDNQAPQPRPIEDRTVTGHPIRVPVATFGADPDGDPVVFTAVVEPPELGRIVRSGTDWFEYEPFEGEGLTGTDTFKIQITDPYGLSATADVRIGVAARSSQNQAPAALDDTIQVKPGLTINYPVLQNDSDPDGDALIVEPDRFQELDDTAAGDDTGGSMRLADTVVEVKVPEVGAGRDVVQTAEYGITDGIGGYSTALLTVTASDAAPNHAPLTQDDVADASMLRGKQAGDTVDIDVLDNDGDLDGAKDDLVLEAVRAEGSQVVAGKLRITLTRASQVVPYRVSDQTGEISFGFVYVAGTDSMPPVLDTDAVPVIVTAGEKAVIELDDVVVVRAGRTPKVARTDRVNAAHGDVTDVRATELDFLAPASYYGAASITLGVLDGVDQNDPEGLEAQITIPVTVLPADNVAPTMRSTSIVVFAGEDPVTVDLARLANDINEDDELSFKVGGAEGGELDTELDGDVLSVSAPADAKSDALTLDVQADDGRAKPTEGRIEVSVIGQRDAATAGPLMRLRELTVEGIKDEELSVDLADAVLSDSVAAANSVVETSVAGPASTPTVSGTVVRTTPNDDGEVVISYRMDDGSRLSDREVASRVVITVAGRPEKPDAPQAVQGGPDSVQLTWRAPDDNGSPITHYVVRWDGGNQDCTATQCVIGGLNPGDTYRFTVEAVNALGTSDPSAASPAVTPNEAPGQMNAPVIEDTFADRDGKLHLRWTPPANAGSEITGYQLTSNPATKVVTTGAGQSSVVWDGLANGTAYTFQILAVNDAGNGLLSPPSAAGVPFTKPSPMAAPSMQVEPPNDDAKGYLTVSWPALTEPDNGFDAVLNYEVKVKSDGNELTTVSVPGGTTTRSFDVENGHSYTAEVRATNRAGTAATWSPESVSKVAWDKAKAPSSLAKSSDCVDCTTSTSSYRGRIKFTTPSDDGGFPVVAYDVKTEDGWSARVNAPTAAERASTTLDVGFDSNRAGQWVELTPITEPTGQGRVAGTSARSSQVFDPYAKPTPPSANEQTRGYRSVTVGWNGGGGNGRTVDKTEYTGDASGTKSGSSGGSVTIATVQGGVQQCVQARTHTAGGWSAWSGQICATAEDRKVTIYFTDAGPTYKECQGPNTSTGRCRFIHYRLEGFKSNVGFSVAPRQNGDPFSDQPISTGSDGRADMSTNLWYTGYPNVVSMTVDGVTDTANP